MTLEEDVELLRNIPLFAKIEPSKLKLLAFTSERLTFNPGDSLFKQGDEGDALYVIMEGEADVLVDTPSGQITVAVRGTSHNTAISPTKSFLPIFATVIGPCDESTTTSAVPSMTIYAASPMSP